jgi:hypothetical protein
MNEIPTIEAFDDGVNYWIFCPFCNEYHLHGRIDGMRCAHCLNNYIHLRSYIIKYQGRSVTKEMKIKQVVIKRKKRIMKNKLNKRREELIDKILHDLALSMNMANKGKYSVECISVLQLAIDILISIPGMHKDIYKELKGYSEELIIISEKCNKEGG